ncbi:MAG: hypothetical protein MUQ30_04535 [Anaerolineae bacterium]|nr:hypothetical protein [Anaerolineae bacterium]
MNNNRNDRLAILAYVIPMAGPIYLMLARRERAYIQYHARQMLALTLALIALPMVWAVVAWSISWVPIAGACVAAALFALVILGFLCGVGIWIAGLAQVMQGRLKPLPVVWALSERWFGAVTDV